MMNGYNMMGGGWGGSGGGLDGILSAIIWLAVIVGVILLVISLVRQNSGTGTLGAGRFAGNAAAGKEGALGVRRCWPARSTSTCSV